MTCFCLNEITASKQVGALISLPCSHRVHSKCIHLWIDRNALEHKTPTCPFCRAPFSVSAVIQRHTRYFTNVMRTQKQRLASMNWRTQDKLVEQCLWTIDDFMDMFSDLLNTENDTVPPVCLRRCVTHLESIIKMFYDQRHYWSRIFACKTYRLRIVNRFDFFVKKSQRAVLKICRPHSKHQESIDTRLQMKGVSENWTSFRHLFL